MTQPSPFEFGQRALKLEARTDHVVILPRGIQGRSKLFEVLRQKLQLPSYFGDNWDALSECLRDLSWLKQRRVVLVHEELPHLDVPILAMYLTVLAESVRDWKPGDEHELLVVFPPNVRQAIASALRGPALEQ